MMNKLVLVLVLGFSAAAQTKVDPSRVARLLNRAVVIDLHNDTTQMIVDEGYNLAEKHDYGQVDIPRMRTGHAGALFLSLWTDTDEADWMGWLGIADDQMAHALSLAGID